MATIPVYSPTIPFLGLVPGGLRPGSMIRIKGVINNHGERCQINIQTGAALNPRDNVTLHLSIRPNEYAIVRNTLQNQVWGTEERHGGCPIHYGQQFDVLVLIEVNMYKIAINGNHFCTFNHRLPVHLAKYVSISGGCVIHSITCEMDTAGPAPPYPGTVPVGPNPPPYTPPMAPYPVHGGNIGFVPIPPPMPPPPPYTPSPSYPVGGPGHYKGVYPQYPGHRGSAPFSHGSDTTPSAPLQSTGYPTPNHVGKPPSPMNVKDTLKSGIQQTKNFLHDAVYGKPSTTHPINLHQSTLNYPSEQPTHYPLGTYPHQHAAGNQYPPYGAPPYQPQATGSYNGHQHSHGSGLPTGAGLAKAAVAAGTAAAVLHKLPKKKSNKLLKYAAGAGVLGLGGYALGKGLRKRCGSSSSSSSSD
ncbi:uncharacterized protein LOC131690797 isoform X2 [Topomyia yanbarensis]|uniref:uncharacterized protein LOC131690797 isoform X2 n=1 Tax=Topomyia yanbarensis TaxID=2498891 RepID=UPI00273C80C1|nr:uncharacterized protein LOC131690797 isoform X2 [Topomyia yanbarensis]